MAAVKKQLNPMLKLALDIGPLVLFFAANSKFGIYAATGAFMVAVLIALDKPFLSIMFDQMFHLTPEGWRKLTWRWALFFLALAVLNEVIWRTQTTDFWVSFKLFGVVPLTFLFGGLQYPLLVKYSAEPKK